MSEVDGTGRAADASGADLVDGTPGQDREDRGALDTAPGGSDPEVLHQAHDTHTPADATASAEDAADTPLTTESEAQRDEDEDPVQAQNPAS